jgi:hypothetical protein
MQDKGAPRSTEGGETVGYRGRRAFGGERKRYVVEMSAVTAKKGVEIGGEQKREQGRGETRGR